MSEHTEKLIISEGEKGLRLDKYLSEKRALYSRSQWSHKIKGGDVHVNGKAVNSSYQLKENDEVEIFFGADPTQDLKDQAVNVKFLGEIPEIIYQDDELLVVNKPKGLVVHPGTGLTLGETMLGWLIKDNHVDLNLPWSDISIEEGRPGIVHRLDRDTSGVMLVAKTPEAHEGLSKQFFTKEAKRLYWAVTPSGFDTLFTDVPEHIKDDIAQSPSIFALRITKAQNLLSLATHLERIPKTPHRFRVSKEGGKLALSHFCLLDHNKKGCLLEINLETGRTHQIRVHLNYLGYPILGDTFYNGIKNHRLCQFFLAYRRGLFHENRCRELDRVESHCLN